MMLQDSPLLGVLGTKWNEAVKVYQVIKQHMIYY